MDNSAAVTLDDDDEYEEPITATRLSNTETWYVICIDTYRFHSPKLPAELTATATKTDI